jgi:hypothetical protein
MDWESEVGYSYCQAHGYVHAERNVWTGKRRCPLCAEERAYAATRIIRTTKRNKYLKRRWDKAQQLNVQPWGEGWRVASSGGGWYYPRATIGDNGKLVHAYCACPDFGECKHNGVPVCKHTLALALTLVAAK